MLTRAHLFILVIGLPMLGAAAPARTEGDKGAQPAATSGTNPTTQEKTSEPQSGSAPDKTQTEQSDADEPVETDTSTVLAPTDGISLLDSDKGTARLSAYALFRATNQVPADQTFTDHLGREAAVDTRRDMQLHRVMVHLRGWFYDPDFLYHITFWTVNDTEQARIIGSLGYRFNKAFSLYGGIGPLPGTRSMMGSHPLWMSHDRVMADEYFRTGFTFGTWANGEIAPNLNYQVMVANNISALGVNATEDTRDLAYGGTLWWMPTTGEFGVQGGFSDFEWHETIATRFGVSYALSPGEDRAAQPSQSAPDTTQIRLGDSLLLFQIGALGDDITVQRARYRLASMDAGIKYKGFFLQAEAYERVLNDFRPSVFSAPIPVESIRDRGLYIQGAYYLVPQKFEVYAATSQVYPDEDEGFRDSSEYLVGINWYWSRTRYQRLNAQVINVNRSPASSVFGFYTGGMDGYTITVDASVLF